MSTDLVQEIKLRTDLVELISGYVPLRPSGRTFKGLCPFHGEKTPSFHVDRERGFFKCYGCGVGGDCFAFIQQHEKLSFHEAGEFLARRVGLEWTRRGDSPEKRSERERLYDVNALAERFFRGALEAAPAVRHYLERRGVTPETAAEFRLGYAPPGYEALLGWLRRERVPAEDALAADLVLQGERGLRDRFVDRLIFPIFDLEGRTVAFGGRGLQPDAVPKYLNSRETPIFQKGRTLYGLHRARRAIPQAGFAVAVEGYMDLIALHQAGIDHAVATLGTAITETHVGILRRYAGEHGGLVMCYDGDSAGMRAAVRGSAMFETAGIEVRVARLPEGDDPDTFIQKHGADAFRAILNRAEGLMDYQLNQLRAGYNLTDPAARLPFVREAARIIARSGSHLTRQEYTAKLTGVLDRLADEWYPGDPRQAMQARLALSHEVSRLLRVGRVAGRATPYAPEPPPAPPPGVRSLAERYVLRAALSEDRWAEAVAVRLSASHFADPALQELASTLLGDGSAEGAGEEVVARAAALRADPASAELVSGLLIVETPLSDEGLEDCLRELEREWMQVRMRELGRALERGELAGDDARQDEYRRLLAELGGRRRRED